MDFLEKDLEDIIFYADKNELANRGLFVVLPEDVPTHYFRQVKLGNYGVCDLLKVKYFGDFVSVTVFELKRKKITKETFFQVLRYARGIQHLAKIKCKSVVVNMIMIGGEIEDSEVRYLPNLFDNLKTFTYSYKFDGIYFREEEGYELRYSGYEQIH